MLAGILGELGLLAIAAIARRLRRRYKRRWRARGAIRRTSAHECRRREWAAAAAARHGPKASCDKE